MSATRTIRARPIAVIALGIVAGAVAYPKLPGPFLDDHLVARFMVAFGLPVTATAVYLLFQSLWTHDRVRSGNGAFEATYAAIVLRVLASSSPCTGW